MPNILNIEKVLHQWIIAANEARERLDLPPGIIEDLASHTFNALGADFVESLLKENGKLAGLMGADDYPLRTWLQSLGIDSYIVSLLEFGAVVKAFANDAAFNDKLNKLKTDRFWPVLFELSMTQRMKKAVSNGGIVGLCAENPDAIGDFFIEIDNGRVACECTRLGFPPSEEEQFRVLDELYGYLDAQVKKGNTPPRCVKIRVSEPLSNGLYNPSLITLVKKATNQFQVNEKKCEILGAQIQITVEPLTDNTERIPFEMINGQVTDVLGTDWTAASSIFQAEARDEQHLAEMWRHGEKFREFEHTRVFIKFPRIKHEVDPYERLGQRIKTKIIQTKAKDAKVGKLIFVECTFNIRNADLERLEKEIKSRVARSARTLGVFLCKREWNPHFRHHYSKMAVLDPIGAANWPILSTIFPTFLDGDQHYDPVTGEKYVRTWEAARTRAEQELAVVEKLRGRNS